MIWEGRVVLWNQANGGSVGDSHGRRDPGASTSQWSVGDFVEIISLDDMCLEDPCVAVPSISNADIDSVRDCANLQHGETCDFQCLTGYTKSGESVCNLGVYLGGACNEDSCTGNPSILNMDTSSTDCTNSAPGDVCNVICEYVV